MTAGLAQRGDGPRSVVRPGLGIPWLAWSSLACLFVATVVYGQALLAEMGARPNADGAFILIGVACYVVASVVLMAPMLVVAALASCLPDRAHRIRLDWSAAVLTFLIGVAAFVIGLRSPDPALGRYSEQAHLLHVAALVITGLPLVVRLGCSPRSGRAAGAA